MSAADLSIQEVLTLSVESIYHGELHKVQLGPLGFGFTIICQDKFVD